MVIPVIPIYVQISGINGPPQGQWTARDWENLADDGNRYEIIEGVVYVSTAPSYFHQWIIKRLVHKLGVPAEEQGLATVDFAPIGVFMPGCEPVQPDLVVVLAAQQSIIRDRRIYGVPDLIAEVLSPGSTDYDEGVKLAAYANAGVPEYVVIDPTQRQLRLYTLLHPGEYAEAQNFNEGDTVIFACLPTLPLAISGLFAGAPDTTV
jgi:Uma2 family endonuclease